MAKFQAFLANVMDAYVYAGSELLFTSKALTDSSISIGVTAEDVRGGKGNRLIGRLFHDSTFGLELQDALFNMNYVALNVGGTVDSTTAGSITEEQVEATASGKLSVSGVPSDFLGQGKIGWIAERGSEDWSMFTFTGDTSNAEGVTIGGQPIIAGDVYCVKYFGELPCEEVVVPGYFVPGEVTVVLKGDLYKASKGNDVSSSSVIGHIEVE